MLRSTGQGVDLNKPQCEMVQGFDVTFRRTDRGIGIVADIAHKIFVKPRFVTPFTCHCVNSYLLALTLHCIQSFVAFDCFSLHQIFEALHQRQHDLRAFFDEHFKDKIAIVSYSKQWIVMESIDLEENERNRFERRDGTKISYGRYVTERYGQEVLFKEHCVIKTNSGAAFLPQFLNVTAKNEQIGNGGIEEIRMIKERMPPNERVELITNS